MYIPVSYTHLDVYKRQPMGRVLMSYFASKYVRLVTGFQVHDTTAGFKCYRRCVLECPLESCDVSGAETQLAAALHDEEAVGKLSVCLLYTSRCV